jgi:hypothetical protein
VKLYGMASPENWFEDFGTGQLSGGSAQIALDPGFAATINASGTYHAFLTPRGECEGLYVGATAPGGFEVRELHHGTSNISFDYRIVAKRRGYESVRLEDITDRIRHFMRKRRTYDQGDPLAEARMVRRRPMHSHTGPSVGPIWHAGLVCRPRN